MVFRKEREAFVVCGNAGVLVAPGMGPYGKCITVTLLAFTEDPV